MNGGTREDGDGEAGGGWHADYCRNGGGGWGIDDESHLVLTAWR